jgi:hypothetical protein
MTVSKLTCPECRTVLKPAKPLAVGKKVKCPKCGTGFTAGEEDRGSAPKRVKTAPAAPPAKKKPGDRPGGKPAGKRPPEEEKPVKKRVDDDEDEDSGGVYGMFKESEDEDKPEINYAPDMSIKDLRGPAQAAVIRPSNYLIITGILGFFGYLGLLIVILIPILFPVVPYGGADKDKDEKSAAQKKKDEKAPQKKEESFFQVFGVNFADLAEAEWYYVALVSVALVLGMCYSGVLTLGAVKAQNLESRTFGIVSCIMAMIPVNAVGFAFLTCLILQVLIGMLYDDPDIRLFILIGIATLQGLLEAGVGVVNLMTLMREEVIAGYEYVAE